MREKIAAIVCGNAFHNFIIINEISNIVHNWHHWGKPIILTRCWPWR